MLLTTEQIQFIIDGLNNVNTRLERVNHWSDNDIIEKCADSYLINQEVFTKDELIKRLEEYSGIFELVTIIRTRV